MVSAVATTGCGAAASAATVPGRAGGRQATRTPARRRQCGRGRLGRNGGQHVGHPAIGRGRRGCGGEFDGGQRFLGQGGQGGGASRDRIGEGQNLGRGHRRFGERGRIAATPASVTGGVPVVTVCVSVATTSPPRPPNWWWAGPAGLPRSDPPLPGPASACLRAGPPRPARRRHSPQAPCAPRSDRRVGRGLPHRAFHRLHRRECPSRPARRAGSPDPDPHDKRKRHRCARKAHDRACTLGGAGPRGLVRHHCHIRLTAIPEAAPRAIVSSRLDPMAHDGCVQRISSIGVTPRIARRTNDNRRGQSQRDLGLRCGRIALLHETERQIVVPAVPEGMKIRRQIIEIEGDPVGFVALGRDFDEARPFRQWRARVQFGLVAELRQVAPASVAASTRCRRHGRGAARTAPARGRTGRRRRGCPWTVRAPCRSRSRAARHSCASAW